MNCSAGIPLGTEPGLGPWSTAVLAAAQGLRVHSDIPALYQQRPAVVLRCSCELQAMDVECEQQPRSDRRYSSSYARSQPGGCGSGQIHLRKWRFPNASRTTHSLDTGDCLLHGNLRRDCARPSRRAVTRDRCPAQRFVELQERRPTHLCGGAPASRRSLSLDFARIDGDQRRIVGWTSEQPHSLSEWC